MAAYFRRAKEVHTERHQAEVTVRGSVAWITSIGLMRERQTEPGSPAGENQPRSSSRKTAAGLVSAATTPPFPEDVERQRPRRESRS